MKYYIMVDQMKSAFVYNSYMEAYERLLQLLSEGIEAWIVEA